MILDVVQYLINGLGLGSLYALIAVGYSLVYGVLQLVNFAHSEIFMTGSYLVMVGMWAGAPLWVALVAAMALVGGFAVVMERAIYKPLRNQHRLTPLITAVGLGLFLQNLMQMIFTANPRSYPAHLPDGIFDFFDGDLFVRQRDLIIVAILIFVTIGLHFFLHRTKQGLGILASAMNPQAAQLVGIPFNRAVSVVFFCGAALAVLAGALQGMAFNQIWPHMGVSAGLKAFAAAVLGGIGVLPGAVLGGLALGVIESLLVGFNLSTYKDGVAFLILVVVLLLSPQGRLGKERMVKV